MDKHLSTQFDAELSGISTRVLEMGGLVESQVAHAVEALTNFSGELASQVLVQEERVNVMEVERVGDHAKNLAEVIIYVVKGTDVRHNSVAAVESIVR